VAATIAFSMLEDYHYWEMGEWVDVKTEKKDSSP
jgi:hypothetical protein